MQHCETRSAASYTTNARFVAFLGTFSLHAQQVWLPGNELNDPSTWLARPLRTLQRNHQGLLQDYDCTEQQAVVKPPQAGAGGAAARAGAAQQPHPAGSQDNDDGKLILPQLHRLPTRPTRGVRTPLPRLPTLKTCSPPSLPSPLRSASPRSSAHVGDRLMPCVRSMQAPASRSSFSATCPRSTRPRNRIQPCASR